jgi:hypothetical protein
MQENFNNNEKPKFFSEEEVNRIRNLVSEVSNVTSWDLEKVCGTEEESELVIKSQEAMEDISTIFGLPSWNRKETLITSKMFLPDEMKKLQVDLESIGEVLSWDGIGGSDEEDLMILDKARESFKMLKEFFVID